MKYETEKNAHLVQGEIKTEQDEKQLLSSVSFKSLMRSKLPKVVEMLDLQGMEGIWRLACKPRKVS